MMRSRKVRSIQRWFVVGTALTSSSVDAAERQDRAKLAAVEWGKCVIARAELLAKQAEPADTLATAAIGNCVGEGLKFRKAYKESTRELGLPFGSTADDETVDLKYQRFEAELRKLAVTAIINKRAE